MTMERVDTSLRKPQTSNLTLTSLSGHSTGSSYANANSYLKSRRVAAKKNRHSDILNFLDSSVDSGTDFLTQISGHDDVDVLGDSSVSSKPPLPTSILTKKKKKKISLGSKISKSAEPVKKRSSDASLSQDSSIEDLLDRLESETGHVSVCSLDTMSSTSLGFDSSSHHLQGSTRPQHEMGATGHSSGNLNGSASSFCDSLFEFGGDDATEYTTIKDIESPAEANPSDNVSSPNKPISKENMLKIEARKRQKEKQLRIEEKERQRQEEEEEETRLEQERLAKSIQEEAGKEAEQRAKERLQMRLQEQKRRELARIEREQKVKEERERETARLEENRRKEEEEKAREQARLEQEEMERARLEQEQQELEKKRLEEEEMEREMLANDHLQKIPSPELQEDETEQSDSSYTEEEYEEDLSDDETLELLVSDDELEEVSVDDDDEEEDFVEEVLLQEEVADTTVLEEFEEFEEEEVLLSDTDTEIMDVSYPEFVEEEIVEDDGEYVEYVLEDAHGPSIRQRLPTLEAIDEESWLEESSDENESVLEELADDESDIIIEEFSTDDEFMVEDELDDEFIEHALSTDAFFRGENAQFSYTDEEGIIYEYEEAESDEEEYVEFDYDSRDEALDEDLNEDEEDDAGLLDDDDDDDDDIEEYWGVPPPRQATMNDIVEMEEIIEILEDDDSVEIIEEEIIPQFKVPIVPAIAAWQMQEEERELADPFALPPEEAPRTPMNIIMAVLAAASSDFKLRKVPEEHKRKYVPMADSAACLGRLTKLQETVVEAMGAAPLKKQDNWKPTGKPIALLRSNNVRIVNEAATLGRMKRLKESYVTNYDEAEFYKDDDDIDIDDQVDERGFRIFRTSKLVHNHVRDAKQEAMARDWTLQCLEETAEAEETDLENVQLPSERIPQFQPSPKKYNSAEELREALSRGVAEGAWDRKYRLERPQVKLRITSMCRCKYCQHPTAYQTHKYKRLSEQAHREVQSAAMITANVAVAAQ